MAIFTDVYENGGYIEFAMGYSLAPNNPSWSGTTSQAGGAFFDDFYLVVELEDTTPDATPTPSVEYDGHYTGVTSYIGRDRTLYLSPNGHQQSNRHNNSQRSKLHYSTDGGNTYTVASAVSTEPERSTKNQVCGFFATKPPLESGTTVDYYWTYSDAAANDSFKILQTPNPGDPNGWCSRSSIYHRQRLRCANDGSAMKLVTLAENTRSSEPHAAYILT